MKNENIVHYDIPRYEMRVRDDCSDECEMVIEDIKDCCKLWVKARNYSNLTNVEGDFDDLAGFQSAIGEEYEAFVLGGTSFSISKTGDHRCRFDSANLGFIGVPKGMNPDKIAEELTAAWNGEYEIYDNLTDDYVDYDYKNLKEWKEEARSKYNIQ